VCQTAAGEQGEDGGVSAILNPVERAMFYLCGVSQEERLQRIASYLRVKNEDILFMTRPGGDLDLIGHFVAVDHSSKSVVLAIRGTYTITGILRDLDACTRK